MVDGVNPEWDALSEWEQDILHELDWEIGPGDPGLRLLIGVLATAVGAVATLVSFTFSLVVAVVGMTIMGLGVGAGVVPGVLALRSGR
jgi:hypothetical protein